MDELFITFSAAGVPEGHLWGTPGSQNGPKTSPKSLRDPSGRQFYTIVVLFLQVFRLIFVVVWVWFRQDIHTKKQSMQKAHIGKQHYTFATVLRCEPQIPDMEALRQILLRIWKVFLLTIEILLHVRLSFPFIRDFLGSVFTKPRPHILDPGT